MAGLTCERDVNLQLFVSSRRILSVTGYISSHFLGSKCVVLTTESVKIHVNLHSVFVN